MIAGMDLFSGNVIIDTTDEDTMLDGIARNYETGVMRRHLTGGWQQQLQDWVAAKLALGETDILADAMPQFERIMLETALDHTHGHKQEAARLLGWGRNTLTRKLKELDIP